MEAVVLVVVLVVVSLLAEEDEVSSVVFGCWAADVLVDDGILCFRRFDAPVEIRTTLSFRLLPPLSPVLLVSSP